MNSLRLNKLNKQLLQEFRNELIRENSQRLILLLSLVLCSQLVFLSLELLHIFESTRSILLSRVVVIATCGVFTAVIYILRNENKNKNTLPLLGLLITGIQFLCLMIGCYFVVFMFHSEIFSFSAFLLVSFVVTLTCVRNPYFSCLIFAFFSGLTVYLHIDIEPVARWSGEFFIALVFIILIFIGNILNYNRHITLFLREKEIAEMNQKLSDMSQSDELTGICNRRKLVEEIENNIELSKRYNKSFSLAILDLDHFKNINDLHGHNTGDAVLAEFSSRMKSMLRTSDIFGRWGGEEFLLLLPNSVQNEAYIMLVRLKNHIENTVIPPDIRITFSAGISCYQNEMTYSELVDKADKALYLAKQSGRNKVVIYQTEEFLQ